MNHRLPVHVKPERYRIMIKPDMTRFTFSGEETIYFELTKPTRHITLHSADLNITSAEVVAIGKDKKDIWAGKIAYNPQAEIVTFTFPQTLSKGRHELNLSFTGLINNHMHGFYRSAYKHKGKTKHWGITQFEATDARRAFPCFDEPAQKAVFDVTLMIPAHLSAVSNTIETEVTAHGRGYKVIKFAPTPKMSTYLLAYVVGEMEFIEGKTKSEVVVRVFTTPGKKKHAKFALEVGMKCLEYYEEYFDIPYPLPVLDMLAVPDFSAQGMENWGAITYRESALLVDEQHTSLIYRQLAAEVIAHELTHQWFGNLVTMEWWTHLWLNESFATYMSYLAIDHFFPQWKIWADFVHGWNGAALTLDSLGSTHPVEVEVRHPEEIDEVFDAVSYGKGASCLRMLAEYIGEKDFRNGLRWYLKKHSYKNTSTVHLWEAFEKVSGKPVRKFMKTWINQPGYPLLRVENGKKGLTLRQSRFFYSPLLKERLKDKSTWPIPVSFAQGQKAKDIALQKRVTNGVPSPFSKVNREEAGFYHTHYSAPLREKLKEALKKNELSQLDRMGLVRDAFALAEAGEMPTSEALGFIKAFRQETSYTVWLEIIEGLDNLSLRIGNTRAQKPFQKFCLDFLQLVKNKIRMVPGKKDSDNTALLRSLIWEALGHYGDNDIIQMSRDLFSRSLQGKEINKEIRASVYATVARHGVKKDYLSLRKLYRQATSPEEKLRILDALVLFEMPELIKEATRFIFSKEVRAHDSPFVFTTGMCNLKAQDYRWQYLRRNWPLVIARYGQGSRMVGRFVKSLSHFSDPKKVREVKKFLKSNPMPGAGMAMKQTLEKLEANIVWSKHQPKWTPPI